jgi:hypothetical protein
MISINGTERIASALRRQGIPGAGSTRAGSITWCRKDAYGWSMIATMLDGHFDD